MRNTETKLIKKIETAFDQVPKPKNITMHVARAIDDYVTDDKFETLRKLANENKWQDISDKDIEQYNDILSFLESDAFRYYIPRFMIWTLNNYKTSDNAASCSTIFKFQNIWDEWNFLNDEQKKVCLEFLEFCIQDKTGHLNCEDAEKAYRILNK